MVSSVPTAHRVLTTACGPGRPLRARQARPDRPEAAGLLSGQVTNEVEALEDGRGCYAALLTNKGKMLG
jgi:hypothetical protein